MLKKYHKDKLLPFSASLLMKATLKSMYILLKGGTLKQYEDNIKALLNNPQWRKKCLYS